MAAPLCASFIVLTAFALVGCGESKQACGGQTTSPGGEVLESELLPSVCKWERDLPSKAVPGARLFVASGCTACHTYRGVGASNLGGTDLAAVGLGHGRRFFERYVADPSRFGNGEMPKFPFSPRQLRQLALFLVASKGEH